MRAANSKSADTFDALLNDMGFLMDEELTTLPPMFLLVLSTDALKKEVLRIYEERSRGEEGEVFHGAIKYSRKGSK